MFLKCKAYIMPDKNPITKTITNAIFSSGQQVSQIIVCNLTPTFHSTMPLFHPQTKLSKEI